MADISKVIKERILVLDGAMGTMIQRYKLEDDDFRNESLKDQSPGGSFKNMKYDMKYNILTYK